MSRERAASSLTRSALRHSAAVRRAIRTELTPRQRQVLELTVLRGLSGAECARHLGVCESTVSRTKARGLARLRRLLGYLPELLREIENS